MRVNWKDRANCDKLALLYAEDVPASVIAVQFGCTANAIHRQAQRQGLTDPERQQKAVKRPRDESAAYDSGVTRRRQGGSASPPAKLGPVARSWWLAGWHDRDIEMGNSVLRGR